MALRQSARVRHVECVPRRAGMKKVGLILSAVPGAGVLQYTQSILEALLSFPPAEYELVAAYGDPAWRAQGPDDRMRAVRIGDSPWDRGVNRAWHISRLPNTMWRQIADILNATVRTLVREKCDPWICPA